MIDFPFFEHLFLISIIKKNEKENLSEKDKKIISNIIGSIELNLRKNKEVTYDKKKSKNSSSTRLKNSILNGLNQALEYSLGNKNNAVWLHKVSISELPNFQSKEIKNIRNKLKLSQNLFAQILGVSKKTVEAWESGKNVPQGPAQRVLFIISKNPIILNELKIIY